MQTDECEPPERVVMRSFLFAGTAIGTFVLASVGPAAAGVGEAVAVIQQAAAKGDTGDRVLDVGSPVFMGDLLTSGPIGEAQLVFVDNTRLVVGPNSSLTIDEFILKDTTTVSALSVNAVTGTFRFISGLSPKQAYSIKTPSATVGIRGTRLDISIASGLTGIVVYEGAADVCNPDGSRCIEVAAGCGAAVATPDDVAPLDDDIKADFIANNFPYALDQEGLLEDFRVGTDECGLIAPIPIDIEISPEEPGAIPTSASPT